MWCIVDVERMEKPNVRIDQYKALFDQTAVGVAITDSDTGAFVRVNKKYTEIVGYSEEQLLQKTFQDINHPEDLRKDVKELQLLIDGEIENYTIDKRFFRRDGGLIWGKLSVKIFSDYGVLG